MYLSDDTLDDMLRRALEKLLKSKNHISPGRGNATEITGVLLCLKNPRARLSHTEKKGKVFSCLGELLWYLAESNRLDFVRYYIPKYNEESEDGKTIYGAYGPRLFRMRGKCNQIQNVVALLKKSPNSRRAVIQLFNAEDIDGKRHTEIPCTCSMQFMIRRKRLEMLTYMRSNDAFLGLPHDIFAFTLLQEIIARSLDIEVGVYKHFVGSLHLYDEDVKDAQQYVNEGWQLKENAAMPEMPWGNPWASIGKVLKAEAAIRRGRKINLARSKLDPYWEDLVRLLQVFRHSKNGETQEITAVRRQMSSRVYNAYITKRMHPKRAEPELSLFDHLRRAPNERNIT
jgi:thymidylate synthase